MKQRNKALICQINDLIDKHNQSGVSFDQCEDQTCQICCKVKQLGKLCCEAVDGWIEDNEYPDIAWLSNKIAE